MIDINNNIYFKILLRTLKDNNAYNITKIDNTLKCIKLNNLYDIFSIYEYLFFFKITNIITKEQYDNILYQFYNIINENDNIKQIALNALNKPFDDMNKLFKKNRIRNINIIKTKLQSKIIETLNNNQNYKLISTFINNHPFFEVLIKYNITRDAIETIILHYVNKLINVKL